MNTTITSTPKQIGKHLAAAEAEPSSRPVFRELAPKTEKETSAINIVLTVIILILSVSIVGYLFSLQPWRQESEVESVQPCEEEICADAETEVPEAPVKAVPLSSTPSDVSVTPVEEAVHAQALRREHHGHVAVVADLMENVQGDIRVDDHFVLPAEADQFRDLEARGLTRKSWRDYIKVASSLDELKALV